MNHFSRTLLFVCVLVSLSFFAHATKRKVLFIGNSYIFTNTMPAMLQSFATAKGDTLIFDESDPGGYTFEQHWVYGPTVAKIFSQQWDIVVLQEQSQRPSFPPTDVEAQVYPYAHKLDSLVRANNPCSQTMFMMTWGRANGDQMNCAFYPVVCTYNGMQGRLRESYMEMTQDNNAIVAPVGAAWKVMMDSFPAIWLYSPDSSHPAVAGSYLQTCVLYSSIFHKKAYGCTYVAGLSTANAQTIQRISDKVVLDSFNKWQQYGHYPSAGYSYVKAGTTVTFSSTSPVPATDAWAFGDGGTDTATNPIHTYATNGSYVVTHTVTTSCFTETRKDTVHIGVTGINTIQNIASPVSIAQLGGGKIQFLLPASQAYEMLEVYDARGIVVRRYALNGNVTDNFAPGLYLYRAYAANRNTAVTGKFIVY